MPHNPVADVTDEDRELAIKVANLHEGTQSTADMQWLARTIATHNAPSRAASAEMEKKIAWLEEANSLINQKCAQWRERFAECKATRDDYRKALENARAVARLATNHRASCEAISKNIDAALSRHAPEPEAESETEDAADIAAMEEAKKSGPSRPYSEFVKELDLDSKQQGWNVAEPEAEIGGMGAESEGGMFEAFRALHTEPKYLQTYIAENIARWDAENPFHATEEETRLATLIHQIKGTETDGKTFRRMSQAIRDFRVSAATAAKVEAEREVERLKAGIAEAQMLITLQAHEDQVAEVLSALLRSPAPEQKGEG